MKQRALKAGVLANPYRFIEAGQVFEHAEAMRWAEPVDDEPAPDDDDVAGDPPAGQAAEPAPARRRKRAEQAASGPADPADPI